MSNVEWDNSPPYALQLYSSNKFENLIFASWNGGGVDFLFD